jgi:hypothetical protein
MQLEEAEAAVENLINEARKVLQELRQLPAERKTLLEDIAALEASRAGPGAHMVH